MKDLTQVTFPKLKPPREIRNNIYHTQSYISYIENSKRDAIEMKEETLSIIPNAYSHHESL